jgi:hypothetical protein
MSWARLDDRWHDHPKVIEAGLEAAGLWAMMLCWAHQHRRSSPNPGVVPVSAVTRLAGNRTKKLTAVLAKVGLLDQADGGWAIHDFAEYLPRYDSEQAAEAGRKGGSSKRTAKQTASKLDSEPASKPLSERHTEPPNDSGAEPERTAERNQARVGTGASARRNPEPEPTLLPSVEETARDARHARTRATANPITAQNVISAWVDACRGNGVEPSKAQISQVGKTAKELLVGNDPGLVLAAAKSAGAKGYPSIDRELTVLAGRKKPAVSGFEIWAEE